MRTTVSQFQKWLDELSHLKMNRLLLLAVPTVACNYMLMNNFIASIKFLRVKMKHFYIDKSY